MKIEIDLPEWCNSRHLFILAGIELVAYKIQGDTTWKVKSGQCNFCGKCCETSSYYPFPTAEDGSCSMLEMIGTEKVCKLGSDRPTGCSVGVLNTKNDSYCTISYVDV